MRTLIELSVLAIRFTLHGTAGVGTVAYALSIGPLTQFLLPRLSIASHHDTAHHDTAQREGSTRS